MKLLLNRRLVDSALQRGGKQITKLAASHEVGSKPGQIWQSPRSLKTKLNLRGRLLVKMWSVQSLVSPETVRDPRYEIHFATEKKPPFFESNEDLSKKAQQSKDFLSKNSGRKIPFQNFSSQENSFEDHPVNQVGSLRTVRPNGVFVDDENFLFPHDDLKSSALLRPFEMYPNERNFLGKTDHVSLKIASSAQIERVGTREKTETREGRPVRVRYGEVENSETVSYKDFKNPHPGGLYCTRTFGPIKNWVCTHPGCATTTSQTKKLLVDRKVTDEFVGAPDGRGKYEEVKCVVCGNPVYPSTLRRYRMGYIHLYQPLVHVSYIHSRQNLFAHLLRWKTKEIHALIYNNLNLINFGHSELFSACFAPLFGFCDDSLGEALEWLRGDYFSLSDQATVVLRLLQPEETRTANRLSQAQKHPKGYPHFMATSARQEPASQASADQSTDTQMRHPKPFLGSDTANVEHPGNGSGYGFVNLLKGQTPWTKNWPPQPNPDVFANAWENSQSFPTEIESLWAPEFATVDTLLVEDHNFLLNLVTDWKTMFTIPKKRDLTLLEKFQVEIFEHDYHSGSPFVSVRKRGHSHTKKTSFMRAFSSVPRGSVAESTSLNERFWTSAGLQPTSQFLTGERGRIAHVDLSEILDFPQLEAFYQNTLGGLESFLKDPELMYSEKFTQNSFFLLEDFLTKFQIQFLTKTKKKTGFQNSDQEHEFTPTKGVSWPEYLENRPSRENPDQTEPLRFAQTINKARPIIESLLYWNPMKFSSAGRFLDFICFRKDAKKKAFLAASGFHISPISMNPSEPKDSILEKKRETAANEVVSLSLNEMRRDSQISLSSEDPVGRPQIRDGQFNKQSRFEKASHKLHKLLSQTAQFIGSHPNYRKNQQSSLFRSEPQGTFLKLEREKHSASPQDLTVSDYLDHQRIALRRAHWYGRGWGEPLPRAVGGYFVERLEPKVRHYNRFHFRGWENSFGEVVAPLCEDWMLSPISEFESSFQFGYQWGRETYTLPPSTLQNQEQDFLFTTFLKECWNETMESVSLEKWEEEEYKKWQEYKEFELSQGNLAFNREQGLIFEGLFDFKEQLEKEISYSEFKGYTMFPRRSPNHPTSFKAKFQSTAPAKEETATPFFPVGWMKTSEKNKGLLNTRLFVEHHPDPEAAQKDQEDQNTLPDGSPIKHFDDESGYEFLNEFYQVSSPTQWKHSKSSFLKSQKKALKIRSYEFYRKKILSSQVIHQLFGWTHAGYSFLFVEKNVRSELVQFNSRMRYSTNPSSNQGRVADPFPTSQYSALTAGYSPALRDFASELDLNVKEMSVFQYLAPKEKSGNHPLRLSFGFLFSHFLNSLPIFVSPESRTTGTKGPSLLLKSGLTKVGQKQNQPNNLLDRKVNRLHFIGSKFKSKLVIFSKLIKKHGLINEIGQTEEPSKSSPRIAVIPKNPNLSRKIEASQSSTRLSNQKKTKKPTTRASQSQSKTHSKNLRTSQVADPFQNPLDFQFKDLTNHPLLTQFKTGWVFGSRETALGAFQPKGLYAVDQKRSKIEGLQNFEIYKEKFAQQVVSKKKEILQERQMEKTRGPVSAKPILKSTLRTEKLAKQSQSKKKTGLNGSVAGGTLIRQGKQRKLQNLIKKWSSRRRVHPSNTLIPFQVLAKLSASQHILAKPYLRISGIAQRVTRVKKQSRIAHHISFGAAGAGLHLPLAHPGFAQNLVTSLDLSTPEQIKSVLEMENQLTKVYHGGLLGFGRSRVRSAGGIDSNDFLPSGNPFNSRKLFERSRIFDRKDFLEEYHSFLGTRNWFEETRTPFEFLSQENQFHNLLAFVEASPFCLKQENRLVKRFHSLFFNPFLRRFISRVHSGGKTRLIGRKARSGSTAHTKWAPLRSWDFSPRGTIREGDPLYGWLPSEHMMQRVIKLLGNASLGSNAAEMMLTHQPGEMLKLKRLKTLCYAATFMFLRAAKPFPDLYKKMYARKFHKATQVDKDGTRFALSSFHRQLQNLLMQKQSRNGFQEYHCEEGATILTENFFEGTRGNRSADSFVKQTSSAPADQERLGDSKTALLQNSGSTPSGTTPFKTLPGQNVAPKAASKSTQELPGPQGQIGRPAGSFVPEPEYDLNCLFDLKSPDDFGPWKRWPEFAKFFLYHGGPTLKKYFRSENWPQKASQLKKRIRRADASVVLTKQITKVFETPKYLGISEAKWKTFRFHQTNRPKPGSIKEKLTEYFREQRALLVREEKRLKQRISYLQTSRIDQYYEWKSFDSLEPKRFMKYEKDLHKEFRKYKKSYRDRQKAIEKQRKAHERIQAQQLKEKEKQQKAFERAEFKRQKEKEKRDAQQRKEHERVLAKAAREKEKQTKLVAEGNLFERTAQNDAKVLEDVSTSKVNGSSESENSEGWEQSGEGMPAANEVGLQTELSGEMVSSLDVSTDECSGGPQDVDPLFAEKFFETDEELLDYFVKFEYGPGPYEKKWKKDLISDKDHEQLLYKTAEEIESAEMVEVLKAKRKTMRPNRVYIDSFNIEKVFQQFPFDPEDVGWSTDITVPFSNTLANPLWRSFLIHEMFRRNSMRDQDKLVNKDLVWDDLVSYQNYPLHITSLKQNPTTSATPRGCLSRMNALVDFDHQIKRYDLTSRKADQKKADQYYQRFQEYLAGFQEPLRKASWDPDHMSEINPQFPVKKRTRKLIEKKRLVKQYRAVLTLLKNPSCIERGVFDKFPILPPDLRPILQVGDVKAVSDMTSLYILLIQRNLRHGKILFESYGESNEFLIDSKTMVQIAADNALDKCREKNVNQLIVGRILDYKDSQTQLDQWASGKPKTKGPGALSGAVPPRTLYDRLSGKEGRFRMNLLGKRVDYSGRSVIIVGPSLHVDQCGVPYEMALELFQPFVLRYMLEDPEKKVSKYLQYDPWIPDDTLLDHLKFDPFGPSGPGADLTGEGFPRAIKSVSQAKLILRKKKALGRMILRQIVPRFPVLLNRAPTLHRLGIQGFHPVLVYGRALHLHPLVCGSFNADFDGDQMAIHIPLSLKARFDIRMLMFAPVNWLSPATGQPTVVPSQDMVLGLFYMTLEKIALQKGRGAFFQTLSDAVQAYETGLLEIQSQIWVKWKGPFANSQMNDESAEELYEETELEEFQFRRKPFFAGNQNQFWSRKLTDQEFDEKETTQLSGPILSKNDLVILRQQVKRTKAQKERNSFYMDQYSTVIGTQDDGVKSRVILGPTASSSRKHSLVGLLGTAGEMTVRARWWNEFSESRLFSTAFEASRQRSSTAQLGSGFSSRMVKESWFEMSRRQQRRRQSGPVKYGLQKEFFYHSFVRFSHDEDEPIEIRLHQTGNSRKIYADFQWFENSHEEERISYIRTTPGRAMINQLIYPAYEEQEDHNVKKSVSLPERT